MQHYLKCVVYSSAVNIYAMLTIVIQHAFVKVFDPPSILVSMLQRTYKHAHQLNSMNYQFLSGSLQ